ncbi:MAG: FtsQ-type POTRA domain-containing protein [Chloroflexota bacterium]|nr:MAG: FtsQ-type POTRA domain-containing protein [Chloroflexota bacterium]
MVVEDKPTRAELLRMQREQRVRKRTPRARHRSESKTSSHLPPVLVRGGLAATATQTRRKSKKNRRRFDIALNGQGAEMRLPSIPMVGMSWRLLSAALVAVLGFLIYMLWSSPFFTVQSIDVAGLARLTNAEIDSVVNVIGNSIIHVDPEDMEQKLQEAFPELVSISVETDVPNKVLMKLGERQPVLAWQQDGQTFWVDDQGFAFPAHGEGGPGITVQGSKLLSIAPPEAEMSEEDVDTLQALPKSLVDAILILSPEVPENTPIVFDSEHGLGWLDPRGWQVYFGSSDEDMAVKLKVYWKTYKRLKKAGIQPALISVEYVHAPYYRLER